MKKEWQTPKLEVLNINMTMAGPGITIPDSVQNDPDEMVHFS
ncbi:paeninodin family lasso peptide [Peribacillus frigoritolerans]|nr:paeninodin family lasso peptide [Peribacillus frigoritolerans]MEA3573918.1 paeninodin family lasso peptide [Peribacillus frigoritolerans]